MEVLLRMTLLRDTFEKDSVHDRWESVYRGSPLQERFNERLLDRILDLLTVPPGGLILDAGCGTGDHTVRIARRGYRCVGVDISENILKRAAARIESAGLSDKASVVCQPLEYLSFSNNHFDAVHARGVLMHIPAWEKALEHLVRVLKPRARMVILELNDQSVESWLVRGIRVFRCGRSRVTRTPGGFEFWSEEGGQPFVARVANIRCLKQRLREMGLHIVQRQASEFWDINRFPPGFPRNAVIHFNSAWFSLHLPALLSSGNMVIAEKL